MLSSAQAELTLLTESEVHQEIISNFENGSSSTAMLIKTRLFFSFKRCVRH